jgi:hypothetical protein
MFAEHLEYVFTPLSNINPNYSEIENVLETPCQMSLPIKPFSPRELAQEIKKVKQYKATAYDLITRKTLRQLLRKALVLLTTIYNSVLRMSYYPILWKFAQIMICKPGNPANEVKSYRPISLLPVTTKPFEKLLLEGIINDLGLSTIIPNPQFGFREGHSTIQQTHRIVNKIITSLVVKTLLTAFSST